MTVVTRLKVLATIMEQRKSTGSPGVATKDFDLIGAELQTTKLTDYLRLQSTKHNTWRGQKKTLGSE